MPEYVNVGVRRKYDSFWYADLNISLLTNLARILQLATEEPATLARKYQ